MSETTGLQERGGDGRINLDELAKHDRPVDEALIDAALKVPPSALENSDVDNPPHDEDNGESSPAGG